MDAKIGAISGSIMAGFSTHVNGVLKRVVDEYVIKTKDGNMSFFARL
jgi:hypothetical protein